MTRLFGVAVCALLCLPGLCHAATVEYWFNVGVVALNPTGLKSRPSVLVNGQWPGPTIYANDGDTVIVHVYNNQTRPITIHWHGITQKGSQWYDGVPAITQCPIKYKTTYTHIFKIQGQVGTFWWHSHVAQLRNTLHGALIVKPSSDMNPEPLPYYIQGDYFLSVGDWYQDSPEKLTADITAVPYVGYPLPDALHIGGGSLFTGLRVYSVAKLGWYRLRVINTAMWAAVNFIVDKHALVLYEAEGGYLKLTPVTRLDVYPGQSYSLLLNANQPVDNYWISITGRFDVEAKVPPLRALAILRYVGAPATYPGSAFPPGITAMSDPTFQTRQDDLIVSPWVNQELLTAPVDRLLHLEINLNTQANGVVVYSTNNVTFSAPSMPYLMADWTNSKGVYNTTIMPDLPPPGLATQKDGPTKYAPSAIQIPYGKWVQVVFQNHVPPGALHPWHLHGYNFYVVARGTGRFNSSNWKSYKYNVVNPPFRNTIGLYENSWVAVRFRATNPGDWIMHCHNEQHADQGMLVVLKVLGPPASLPPPPSDYPKC